MYAKNLRWACPIRIVFALSQCEEKLRAMQREQPDKLIALLLHKVSHPSGMPHSTQMAVLLMRNTLRNRASTDLDAETLAVCEDKAVHLHLITDHQPALLPQASLFCYQR